MRAFRLMVPLLLVASPAFAAPPAAAEKPDPNIVPPQLTDPATADKLGAMMQGLSKAFLDLPVGEVEAAVEGRPATPADRKLTVRDIGRRDDPDFERNLDRRLADSRAVIQSSMKAFATALPAVLKSLDDAGRALEKATANMPSPNYPKR